MESSSVAKERHWGQACVRVSLNRILERPLLECVKLQPRLPWRPQNIGDARTVAYLEGSVDNRSGTRQRERSRLQSTMMKGVEELTSQWFDTRYGCRISSFSCWFLVFFWSTISSLFFLPFF